MKNIKIFIKTFIFLLALFFDVNSTEILKKNPYSFDNIVSFSSDVDSQIPEKGMYMHDFFNKLGLHISDSIYLKGYFANSTSNIFNNYGINKKKSLIKFTNHFELLLKQWHRGNINTYHSANSDVISQYNKDLKIELSNDYHKIIIGKLQNSPFGYDYIRIKFNKKFKKIIKLQIELEKKVFEINNFSFKSKEYFFDNTFIIEFKISEIFSKKNVDLSKLKSLSIKLFDCQENCKNITVKSIQLDSFGKRSIERFTKFINLFNLNSKFITDHGGLSGVQNFGDFYPRIGMANEKGSPFFLLNILKELGIEYYWKTHPLTYISEPNKLEKTELNLYKTNKQMTIKLNNEKNNFLFKDSYYFNKNLLSEIIFKEDLNIIEKLNNCYSMSALDTACDLKFILGEILLRNNQTNHSMNLLLYAHFGYNPPHSDEFENGFFDEYTKNLFKKLSFNFYAYKNDKKKIWVVPSVVFLNYQRFQKYFKDSITIENNKIFIISELDKMTNKKFPDFFNGTSDLTGITIYTKNSKKAKVFIDGKETNHFTRNKADKTGRESITFYNNNSPTPILNKNPITNTGIVNNKGFEINHPYNQLLSLKTLSASNPEIEINFFDKKLYNISHFEISYDKNINKNAIFYFLLEKKNKELILISDSHYPKEIFKKAHSSKLINTNDDKVKIILPIHSFNWNYSITDKPINSNGEFSKLKIGILNSKRLDYIQNIKFIAHRMNGNKVKKNVPIGGKVLVNNLPINNTSVSYSLDNKKYSTLTDEFGSFYFFNVKKGNIIELNVGKNCKNNKKIIEILKPEVEINFNLNNCK